MNNLIGLLLSSVLVSAPADVPISPVEPYTPVSAPIAVEVVESTAVQEDRPETAELREYALAMSQKYGVSFHEMSVTINCESGWNPDAANPEDSDGGSWGIVQINIGSDAHPEILKSQALDPHYSIEFMANEFAKGNQWKWTCWNMWFGR